MRLVASTSPRASQNKVRLFDYAASVSLAESKRSRSERQFLPQLRALPFASRRMDAGTNREPGVARHLSQKAQGLAEGSAHGCTLHLDGATLEEVEGVIDDSEGGACH